MTLYFIYSFVYLELILQYFSLLKRKILFSIWNPDITSEIPSGSFSASEQNNVLPYPQTELLW